MITVSTLSAFDPATWTSWAEWSTSEATDERRAQVELRAQAVRVATAWPSWVGRRAVNAILKRAEAHGELAVAYTDGATVINAATLEMTGFKGEIVAIQTNVHAKPALVGPDEGGVVSLLFPPGLPDMLTYLQNRSEAMQFTMVARQVLMQASDRDRTASLALLALLGMTLPNPNDGPIDLTDDGIRLQADLNSQDRYGDCTTLSTLISLGKSDPNFVREHMVWDESTGTYQVTLYRDGEPVTVSVDPDDLPSEGSQQAATNKPSWMSVYEQAIEQEFGDIENGQFEDVPISRITGKDVPLGPPPSAADIRDATNRNPPGIVTADTANAPRQPDDVDPAKRVVPGHTYSVQGIDADGNVILQNPWGPSGGWHDKKYYPGEVHLTPEEYQRWFSNGAVLNPPF